MAQEQSAQAGAFDNSKQRFDSKAYKGERPCEESAGPQFDMISCFHVDAELALDAICHKICMFAVLG